LSTNAVYFKRKGGVFEHNHTVLLNINKNSAYKCSNQ